eukprot:scaffold47180_cov58-Phaeocystis_antarctica.AAC.1
MPRPRRRIRSFLQGGTCLDKPPLHEAPSTSAPLASFRLRRVVQHFGVHRVHTNHDAGATRARSIGRDLGGSGLAGGHVGYFSGARGGERRPRARRVRVAGASRARRGRLSPKGRGRVGLASRPPVGTSVDPFARASFPGARTRGVPPAEYSVRLFYTTLQNGGAAGGAMGALGCPRGAGVFLYTAPPYIPCNCTQPDSRAFYALCTLPCVTGSPDNTHVTRAR